MTLLDYCSNLLSTYYGELKRLYEKNHFLKDFAK